MSRKHSRREKLKIGYSPCPNDTYIFHALKHGLVEAGFDVEVKHHDVETLNEKAFEGEFDVTKISFHAFGHVVDDYGLLRSGGALGEGVGPIVVARDGIEPEELDDPSLDVVIPGELTTAHLLLKLHSPGFEAADERVFDEIMPEVSDGVYDAGLVIHEGRFTYDGYGLEKVLDLGEWWESETGRPVPLGGIVARRDIGVDADDVENAIRRSVEHARDNPEASREYVREHAQEMDDEVIERHIDLYVNDYSIEMGDEGVGAVDELLRRGRDVGALPASDESVLATSDE